MNGERPPSGDEKLSVAKRLWPGEVLECRRIALDLIGANLEFAQPFLHSHHVGRYIEVSGINVKR
jgi:hypothetical protein